MVLLSDVPTQPRLALERSGLLAEIGGNNVCADIDQSLERARLHLGVTPEQPLPTSRA
jgi:hypothetical protein